MKFRKGDIVSVRGVVKYNFDPILNDPDKRVFVDIDGNYETIWINPENLQLTCQAFEIGDAVTWGGDAENLGVILMIHNGHAWIDRGNGDFCTRLLSTIERFDQPEGTDAAAS